MHNMVKKKMCYRWHGELPLPHNHGDQLDHLVSLSTTVNMPLNDLLSGRSVMKSIDHTEKRSTGLSMGCNKPSGAEVKSCCWQTRHPCTNAETSCDKPTKHGKAEKTKSCGYLSVCKVCNASLTTKANEVHHPVE